MLLIKCLQEYKKESTKNENHVRKVKSSIPIEGQATIVRATQRVVRRYRLGVQISMQPLYARRLEIEQRVDPICPPLLRLKRVSATFVILLDLLVRGHILGNDVRVVDHEAARRQKGHNS